MSSAVGVRRRGEQRRRLLEATVEVVRESGVAGAKVGEIAHEAGVSRATFYEVFQDKQACLNEAHAQITRDLERRLLQRIGSEPPARASESAVEAVLELAKEDPGRFVFAVHEGLLVGPRARAQYDRLLETIEQNVEARSDQAPAGAALIDLPSRIALGGAVRLCSLHVRRGEPLDSRLAQTLSAWLAAYRHEAGPACYRHRLRAPPHLDGEQLLAPITSGPARRLPRGRHRLAKETVARIQRERIAHAVTAATREHHPDEVSVANIVARAGLSREVFYEHFSDKEQAFLAAHQLVFEQLMAACSSAYFKPDLEWPERVWQAGRAFAALLAANPDFANFAFVCAYGIGEVGARRVDESVLGFALFLEDGYRMLGTEPQLPHSASAAIALAVAGLASHRVRNGRTHELPGLVPAVAYTTLAPFIGARQAWELIERNTAETAASSPSGAVGKHG